jgi:hypothetical protein
MIVNGMRKEKPYPFSKLSEFIQGRKIAFKWRQVGVLSKMTVAMMVFAI